MYFLDDEDQVGGDDRHQRRVLLMQLLFAGTFQANAPVADLVQSNELSEADLQAVTAIKQALPDLDALIAAHAPERPLSEINQVDLAIMRLIIFESQTETTPKKVLADEAVELAKEFGSETSAKFVNGVLGKILFPAAEPAPESER
jgi:N utilization substance protein B